jgi:hypothetical protein
MVGNSNDPQELPVIDDAFHDEVLRGLERDDVPTRVRSRLPGALGTAADTGSSRATKERLFTRQRRLLTSILSRRSYANNNTSRAIIVVATTVDAPNRGEFACGRHAIDGSHTSSRIPPFQ